MSSPSTVLIVELDQALAELAQTVLDDAGYHVVPTLCGPDSLQTALQMNPDVIVLDLGMHTHTCGWQLLKALRSNPDTQGIPLVVISDTEQLLEDAKQSFNVRQELTKPYDIEDLIKAVRAALSGTAMLPHPAPAPTQGKLSTDAAQAISRDAGQIMHDWLQKVEQENVLGSASNVPKRVLMDNISVWMIGLVSVLRYGEGYLGTSEIQDKLAEHIRDAKCHGVDLSQVIKQFEILRDLVWQDLEKSNLANLTTRDVFQLGKKVNTALDEVLVQISKQYTMQLARTAGAS